MDTEKSAASLEAARFLDREPEPWTIDGLGRWCRRYSSSLILRRV